ncbi:WIP domain protein 5 [Striga asiatica]|uniref:WIP domain protein 5 n=1 Tax=Striga asiatica TaxID=4170 RepID=A0A5A7QRG5_STRAF|nr:WIP domain protein 5 [Striga asiatica]
MNRAQTRLLTRTFSRLNVFRSFLKNQTFLPPKTLSPNNFPPIYLLISDLIIRLFNCSPPIPFLRVKIADIMDSDDDYQSFSPPKEQSPQVQHRRLKRLKKSSSKPSDDPLLISIDDPLLFPNEDFARLEALENGTATPDSSSDDLDSTEEAGLSRKPPSQGYDDESGMGNKDEMESGPFENVKKTKRVLEFDDPVMGGGDAGEGFEGFELDKDRKQRTGEEDVLGEGDDDMKINRKKKQKKSGDSNGGDELQTNLRGTNKRTEKKERNAYLKELHAESQRLLRETRDASFKPIPVVQKPISSVLDKIRKRKLEISKKFVDIKDQNYVYDGSISPKDRIADLDVSYEEREEEILEILVEKEKVGPSLEESSSLAASSMDGLIDTAKQTINENHLQQSPVEDAPPAFRAPVFDTEDLFDVLEPNGITATASDEPSSPLEEDFAPSLLTLNLKFDSAPVDDSASDEDDNDKENVDPHPCGIADGSSSPKGEFAKDFIDDEAEEEDDSDNDLSRFKENDDAEDAEDFVELNDMIATGYEERSIDNERRNELHQKWLEQQDAAGTDKLMQKLNFGSGLREAMLLDKEPEIDENDQELGDNDDDDNIDNESDEGEENPLPRNSARINTKKAKQIILEMLTDKDDAYVSDDDDDDTQRRHARRLLIRKEKQTTVVSPAEDESSREVFGLIKKLNIVPDNKKKPKATSFFDTVLKGGNSNSSSKSSFLGRVSNHSMSSSHKQGSGAVRSFIFGRDDSNSRSSMSISEDSSDTVSQEARPTRTLTAKYISSQTKFTSQSRQSALETSSRTSLLDILKQSSSRPQACNTDTAVDLMKGIFAFRAPKNPTKLEGRS